VEAMDGITIIPEKGAGTITVRVKQIKMVGTKA
jgi:hypothetical protein